MEFWTYGTLYGHTSQVFKITERAEFVSIHEAASILIEERGYTLEQAYAYLVALPHG